MSRRSTEPCQLVSTPPERETAYFLISLKSFAMPPWGAYADVSEKIVSRKPLGSLTSNARLFHSVS